MPRIRLVTLPGLFSPAMSIAVSLAAPWRSRGSRGQGAPRVWRENQPGQGGRSVPTRAEHAQPVAFGSSMITRSTSPSPTATTAAHKECSVISGIHECPLSTRSTYTGKPGICSPWSKD